MRLPRMRNRRDQASATGHPLAAKLLVGISALALLSGCSSVPDEVNPVQWYRGASAWVSGDEAAADSNPSAVKEADNEDVPFPNLASVPERPKPTPEPGEVERMMASLESDRAEAKAADAELRSRPIAQPETKSASIALPTPTPGSEETASNRRFPPLELPDLDSALGDSDSAPTGRFPMEQREGSMNARASQPERATPDTTSPPSSMARAQMSQTPMSQAPMSQTGTPARPPATPTVPSTRRLASVKGVAPRPPIQPPEPFSTGRRSFASATSGAASESPAPAIHRVTPRPPIQPPQPYSAPRSSVSLQGDDARAETSLAELVH